MKIDNKDILSEYGLTLLDGSYDDVFRYPNRTPVEYNNWAENDGIDPDLTSFKTVPKTIRLSFLQESGNMSDFQRRYNLLASQLTMAGYRNLAFESGLSAKVRFDKNSMYSVPVCLSDTENKTTFTLECIEDTPSIALYTTPAGGIPIKGLYTINGIDFGAFGISSDQEQGDDLRYPDLKDYFTDGRYVYVEDPKYAHREFSLQLWMYARSKAEFIRNHAAFWYNLSQPETFPLYINSIGRVANVYYTGCPVFSLVEWGENECAAQFTITLVCPVVTWVDKGGITRYRVLWDNRGTNGLLADEKGNILVFN